LPRHRRIALFITLTPVAKPKFSIMVHGHSLH
jgi:hypothetical protein